MRRSAIREDGLVWLARDLASAPPRRRHLPNSSVGETEFAIFDGAERQPGRGRRTLWSHEGPARRLPPARFQIASCRDTAVFFPFAAWASAHRGKWGQLIPLENWWKKTKKRKHAKRAVFLKIQIYFRMHHFVVKFSKKNSPQTARGHYYYYYYY